MKVLFVQRQPCIRTLKYAEGLIACDVDIELSFAYELLTLSEFYGHGDEHFAQWWKLGDDPAARLREIVAEQGIDIIHCHNGPDTLTNVCIDCFSGQVPIVHDIHDLMSARMTEYDDISVGSAETDWEGSEIDMDRWLAEERRAVEQSDGVIAVSDEILDIATRREYRLPEACEVYANYIPERFIPQEIPEINAEDRSGPLTVVYEGSLSTNAGHYDLRSVFVDLAAEGFEVHVHPSRAEPTYSDLARATPGLVYHDPLSPERLYEQLPRYDLGWAGFNDTLNRAHLETVLPNKLFEYVACGLPVLSFRHHALATFIEQHSAGVVIDDVPEIRRRLTPERLASLRQSVRAQRHDFTVEANVGRVTGLYGRLVADRLPA